MSQPAPSSTSTSSASSASTSSSSSSASTASASTSATTSSTQQLDYDAIDYHHISPRFSINDATETAAGLAYLEEYGYVVWSDVASPEQTEQAHDEFWSWMTTTFGKRLHLSRHSLESWENLPIMGTGVCWNGGIGNSSFAWFVRSLPNVKKVYSSIWGGEENLVSSMDGCGIFRPTLTYDKKTKKQVFREEFITKSAWFHVDQNPRSKPNKECVQGLVSIFDQNEHTGGLIVVPKSHHQYNSLTNLVKPKSTADFVSIPEDNFLLDRALGAERPYLVHCKAGDLVCWDSRAIHCNAPALRDQIFLKKQREEKEEKERKKKAGESDSSSSSVSMLSNLMSSLPSISSFFSSSSTSDSSSSSSSSIPPLRLQRLVSYQCMTPYSKIAPNHLAQYKIDRLDAVKRGVTTNHWPHEFHNGMPPSTSDPFTPIELTAYQRELVVGKGN